MAVIVLPKIETVTPAASYSACPNSGDTSAAGWLLTGHLRASTADTYYKKSIRNERNTLAGQRLVLKAKIHALYAQRIKGRQHASSVPIGFASCSQGTQVDVRTNERKTLGVNERLIDRPPVSWAPYSAGLYVVG